MYNVSRKAGDAELSLVCVNGSRECVGCRECTAEKRDFDGFYCEVCGEHLESGEMYSDAFYELLCRECLLELHKL